MRRTKKTISKRKNNHIEKTFDYLRGSATITLLIVIIIIGSVMFAGGIFPQENPEIKGIPGNVIIDETSLPGADGKKSLQLETFKFKECATKAAVNFLVDNSGSMDFGSKLEDLKSGLKTFGAIYPEEGVIGLQVYSSPKHMPSLGHKELIPISIFSTVTGTFDSTIDSMVAKGATHSKDAMEFAKTKLDSAQAAFPENKFNLIFISDGIPEDENNDINDLRQIEASRPDLCGPSTEPNVPRCFAESQNPTEIAEQIKASGVRIFTIAYVDTQDDKFNDLLQNLMRNVASTPDDYYLAPVSDQIDEILTQIGEKFCE